MPLPLSAPTDDRTGFTVAIVGRPNTGKSTLFNRLTGTRAAIVDPQPGVTRDRREGEGRLGHLAFRVIDTAGLEEQESGTIGSRMRDQTGRAIDEADVLVFVVDGRTGPIPDDAFYARELRKSDRPIVLVANKCESRRSDPGLQECWSLGLGAPVPVSAEHGHGMNLLLEALAPHAVESDDEDQGDETVRLAVIGRPNVGKSTLVNRLIGEERVITGPEPGITRDAVSVHWKAADMSIELIDTAGMRRRSRVTDRVEKMSVSDTLTAIRFAHVVLLMLEAGETFSRQDLAIADLVEREGRGLIVGINKWDTVRERAAARRELNLRIREVLPQVRGVPMIFLSALQGKGVNRLIPAIKETSERWNRRIETPRLNRWLENVVETHPPPVVRGGRIRLRYVTQPTARPPTFIFFGTRVSDLPEAYQRYLANRIRKDFDLPGIPIRVRFRSRKNPYDPG